MKKTIKFLMLFTVMATLSFNVTSCKDEEVVIPEGDKTALNALIADCETLISGAEEGTSVNFYQVGSKAVFQTAIDAAKAVSALSLGAFQDVVDGTTASLNAAKGVFEGMYIQNVSTDGLVAQWLFTGDATDFTGNGNDGVVSVGNAAFGAGTPALATDRFGNADNAYSFNNGAFIKVPYTTALNPTSISIALWVYAAEVNDNNRFMGLQSWNGYKFQLQSVNKSFFTAATVDGIYDRDTDPPLEIDTWYHLAVTFTSGTMTFYVDGVQTQEWTELTGDLVAVTGHDLAIGCGSSKYADTDANYDADHIIPASWGGYFRGSLDDIRLYNRVLTSAEVASIYALEKPQ